MTLAAPAGFTSVRMCSDLPPPLPGDLWQSIDNRSGKPMLLSVASCIALAGAPHQWHATFQEGSRHIQFSPAREEALRQYKYVPIGWIARKNDFLAPVLDKKMVAGIDAPAPDETWSAWLSRMALARPDIFAMPNSGSFLYARWRMVEEARRAEAA